MIAYILLQTFRMTAKVLPVLNYYASSHGRRNHSGAATHHFIDEIVEIY